MNISLLRISIYSLTLLLCSCNQPAQTEKESVREILHADTVAIHSKPAIGVRATSIDKNISCIFQDSRNFFWFGTDGEGVYRYDGNAAILFTEADGLANNQVRTIQQDKDDNIWINTAMGVSRFDGTGFSTFPNEDIKSVAGMEWKSEPGDLWFEAGGGVYRYDGDSFTYLPLPGPNMDYNEAQSYSSKVSQFTVYSLLKDRSGSIWIGTQALGVCRFDPATGQFTWFTEHGLAGPAVLAIFEDRNGELWFGNNGAGLFRYDGKSLTNITKQYDLENEEFLKERKISVEGSKGSMARIYSINESNDGNLWIGTIDAGAWRFDGKSFTNYTTKDGLSTDVVNAIYKDRSGELWFGTTRGVSKFNGRTFNIFMSNQIQ